MYENDSRLPSQKDINDNFNPSLFVNKNKINTLSSSNYYFLYNYFLILCYTIREIGSSPFPLYNQIINKH